MFKRKMEGAVLQVLSRQAAVALLGPRQVGKTTLALQIAVQRNGLYLDLEDAQDRAKLSDPSPAGLTVETLGLAALMDRLSDLS